MQKRSQSQSPPSKYTLHETQKFKDGVEYVRLLKVDEEILNDVLAAIRWALRQNPMAHELVNKAADIRMLKTDRVPRGTESVPMLRVLYRVADGHTVELLRLDTLDFFL